MHQSHKNGAETTYDHVVLDMTRPQARINVLKVESVEKGDSHEERAENRQRQKNSSHDEFYRPGILFGCGIRPSKAMSVDFKRRRACLLIGIGLRWAASRQHAW